MRTDKKRVYLDDIRTPIAEDWIVARNYDEFVDIIKTTGLENIEVISLDHDLGEQSMIEYYNNVKPNYELNYNNFVKQSNLAENGRQK